MIEVEVKARALPGMRERIESLGALPVGRESHRDIYFGSPRRDFRKSDEALRIRIKEEGARLTYKGPKLDETTKSRRELTVEIDSPETMEQILISLGFFRAGVVRKIRTKYQLGEATIAIDEVEGLGSFLEVELTGGEDWSGEREKAIAILRELGAGESIRSSYLEMLLAEPTGTETRTMERS
jgi:adenylate cyclase class 2